MPIKHVNPKYSDRTAIAPYNFVPLPPKILTVAEPPPQDRLSGYSGYFDCELETCSPTYIRGMLTMANLKEGKEAKDLPAPFSLDGGKTPALPGSSLRGVFRSLIEIVTYSKPNSMTDQKQVYRAVGDTTRHGTKYRQRIMSEDAKNTFTPKVQAGYLHYKHGDWYIQPAQEIGGTTFARILIDDIPPGLSSWNGCKNASTIYIQPGKFDYQDVRGGFLRIRYSRVLRASEKPGTGLQMAVLARSGKMFSKKSEAVVFQPDPQRAGSKDWLPVNDEMIEMYRSQVSDEQNDLLVEQKNLGREVGVLRDFQPVFYLVENNQLVFFGHTMMMRLPYIHSPLQLIPEHLRREQDLDMVEALFGYTKSESACAGRLFFSDAVYQSGQSNPYEPEIKPQVLGSPKPTTFQHYLEQSDPDDKSRLMDYDDQSQLRGHKLYWHKGARTIQQIQETDSQKLKHARQYTLIRPLRSGVRFRFWLRFENLTVQELGALVWVLELGSQPNYRLKIGMGKPLGMGAIKVRPTLHLMQPVERYKKLFDTQGQWASGEQDAVQVEKVRDQAIQAFSRWVLDDLTINPGKAADLANLPRLQALLRLLSWPGPDPEQTRYMEIERPDKSAKRGKRNEYRERPVLPDPGGVGGKVVGATAPKPKTAPLETSSEQPRTDDQVALRDQPIDQNDNKVPIAYRDGHVIYGTPPALVSLRHSVSQGKSVSQTNYDVPPVLGMNQPSTTPSLKNLSWKRGRVSKDQRTVTPLDTPGQSCPFKKEHVLPKGYSPAGRAEVEFAIEDLPAGEHRVWVKKLRHPVE